MQLRYVAPLLGLYLLAAALGPSFVENSDEATYLFYADQLLDGRYADHHTAIDAHYLWFGPGLPLVMAPLVAAGLSIGVIRLAGAVLLLAAVLVFHRLCLRFMPERYALLAALGLALYVPYLVLVARLTTEPLALLAFVTGLLFAVRYVRGGSGWELGAAALALGYLAMTRVAYGYVLAAMILVTVAWWLWRRHDDLRRWALVFAASLAVCVPWLAYTWTVTDEPFYWGNSGAQNLYWIASPSPGNHGDWRAPDDPMDPADRAFLQRIRPLDPLERDHRTREAALENVRDHPGTYAEHVGLNVARMLVDAPHSYGDGHGLRVFLYALPNLLLIAAVVVSLARGRERPWSRELSVLVVLGAIIFVLHALLAAEPRMLALVVPLAILLAASRQPLDSPAA